MKREVPKDIEVINVEKIVILMVIPVHFSWSSGDSRRMPSSRSPFPSPALRVPLRYGSEMRLDGIRKASSPLMSFPLPLPSLERSEGQRTEVAKE